MKASVFLPGWVFLACSGISGLSPAARAQRREASAELVLPVDILGAQLQKAQEDLERAATWLRHIDDFRRLSTDLDALLEKAGRVLWQEPIRVNARPGPRGT